MKVWLRRLFKLILVSILLVYLAINSFLNLPPVRRQLHSFLVETVGRPVTMGYIYLDWQLNPSLSYLGVGEENYDSDRKPGTAIFHHIRADMNWSRLREAFEKSQPLQALDKINIYSLTYNHKYAAETGPEIPVLPEITVDINRWEFYLVRNDRDYFRLAGRNLQYRSTDQPLEFDVSYLAGRPAAGRGKLDLMPRPVLDLEMDYFQLEGDYWGGFSSAWRGDFHFAAREDGLSVLDVKLEGLPGRFQNFNLPPVDVDLSLFLHPDRYRLERLNVDSNYFVGSCAGEIDREGKIDELGGEFKLYPDHMFRWLNKIQDNFEFDVKQTSNLEGLFRLENNIFSPRPSGELKFPGAVVDIIRDESEYELKISDWLADFQQEGLHWEEGNLAIDGVGFALSGGLTGRDRSVFTTTWTGLLTGEDFGGNLLPGEIIERIGTGQSMRIPVNLTFEVGRKGIQASFLTRDGDLYFPDYSFENIWFFASYSLFERVEYSINGRFLGPDGNNWEVMGEENRPLEFSTRLEKLDYWLDLFYDRPEFIRREIKLEGADFLLRFNNPFLSWTDFKGELNFKNGRLFFVEDKTGLTDLEGKIEVGPARVLIDGLQGSTPRGSLSVAGSITHRDWFREGNLDLEFQGNNFYSRDFFPEGTAIEFENLDFSGVAKGTLEEPLFGGELTAAKISAGNIKFLNTGGELELEPSGFSFTLAETSLGGGTVSGRVSGENINEVELNLRGTELQPAVLLEHNDYIRENIRGSFSIIAELTGDLTDWQSWDGNIELEHSDFNLAQFPDISGIHRVADLKVIGQDVDVGSGIYQFEVHNGLIEIRDFVLNAPDKEMEMLIRGDIGLDGSLNLRQDLILRGAALRSYLQDLIGDFFRGIGLSPEREFVVRFYLHGTVAEPEFEFDVEHARRGLQQDFISSFISERLGRPISRILNRLF